MNWTATFIENVRILCKWRHIKITDLEKVIGVSAGYLSRCGNKKDIGLTKACDICEILDVPMSTLLSPSLVKQKEIVELETRLAQLKAEVYGQASQ